MQDHLNVRYLGICDYLTTFEFQRNLAKSDKDYLLLLSHPPVYTLGLNADNKNILFNPNSYSVPVIKTDRGGDVTYHGPGQLVGYLIKAVTDKRIADFINLMQQSLMKVLERLGIPSLSLAEYPGVWVNLDGELKKIAAIGVRIKKGRSYHGFALNVRTDLEMFSKIIPCGIADKGVTSIKALGVEIDMHSVVDMTLKSFVDTYGYKSYSLQKVTDLKEIEKTKNQDTSKIKLRLLKAGVNTQDSAGIRKPAWVRRVLQTTNSFLDTQKVLSEYGLNTVCKEANCPNRFECWSEKTATFLINGKICTRACGFCDVTTGHPKEINSDEINNLIKATKVMRLKHVVITAPARDDLEDGGASGFAQAIKALRDFDPSITVEVLVPDFKGDKKSLDTVISEYPDVFNHNIETVLRLQKAIRPQAGYMRSLNTLAYAKQSGLIVKSGLIIGMGEETEEIKETIVDLAAVGVDILTVGQYLSPSRNHAPVMKYYTDEEFEEIEEFAYSSGIQFVQANPLVRSSYLAHSAIDQFKRRNHGLVNQR